MKYKFMWYLHDNSEKYEILSELEFVIDKDDLSLSLAAKIRNLFYEVPFLVEYDTDTEALKILEVFDQRLAEIYSSNP